MVDMFVVMAMAIPEAQVVSVGVVVQPVVVEPVVGQPRLDVVVATAVVLETRTNMVILTVA